MKKGLWQKLLLVMVAVALIAAAFPAVSAYEGHLVDIKASVEQPVFVSKTAHLATSEDILNAKDNSCWPWDIEWPDNPNVGVTDPFNVPQETSIAWVVTIGIVNFTDEMMPRVTVYDEFDAELYVAEISHTDGSVNIIYGGGNWGDPNQYRLRYWELSNFAPGDCASLQLLVWTAKICDYSYFGTFNTEGADTGIGINCVPECHYGFTGTGCRWLNLGATMKWYEWVCDDTQTDYDCLTPQCDWQELGSYATGPVLPVVVH